MRRYAKIMMFLLPAVAVSSLLPAQGRFIEKKEASLWFGVRDITRDSLANGANLDFLNYLHSSDEMAEYQYLGLSAHLWFRGNWEADFKVAMYDDFAPTSLNIKAIWMPYKYLGLTVGFYSYPQLMNEFNMFHRLSDEGWYGDTDSNFRQRRVHETGIMAGVAVPVSYRFIHLNLCLNGGISTLSKFREKVTQKMINGNMRREIRYSTKNSPALFFFPEAELGLDCFRIGSSTLGVRGHASWFTVKRSVDYKMTIWEWTYDNPMQEDVANPAHSFSKFEFDAGLYLTW